jgi:hypothetical protein
MPLVGLNSAFMIVLRAEELYTLEAAASVKDAPKPTIDWSVVFGFTVITAPLPDVPKATAAFCVSKFVLSGVVSHTLADVAARADGPWVVT